MFAMMLENIDLNLREICREKKIHRLHLERIVNYFLNPLTRNIDFQIIRIR